MLMKMMKEHVTSNLVSKLAALILKAKITTIKTDVETIVNMVGPDCLESTAPVIKAHGRVMHSPS